MYTVTFLILSIYLISTRHVCRKKLSDTDRQVSRLSADKSALLEVQVPALIDQCATNQSVRVLQGDYDLKIARQDYFIANQVKVNNLSTNQNTVNNLSTNQNTANSLSTNQNTANNIHKSGYGTQ